MRVTINHPDDIDGTDIPLYEGPAENAHTVLIPGEYATNIPDVVVLVTEDASVAALTDREVTIVNEDNPADGDWTGRASEAHLDPRLGSGIYTGGYMGNDGDMVWAEFHVEDDRSYLEPALVTAKIAARIAGRIAGREAMIAGEIKRATVTATALAAGEGVHPDNDELAFAFSEGFIEGADTAYRGR